MGSECETGMLAGLTFVTIGAAIAGWLVFFEIDLFALLGMIDMTWFIGFLASIFITLQVIPQTVKMWELRHKPLNEFSPLWFIFGIVGSALFITYGLLIGQVGLIILNLVCLASLILMFLIFNGVWTE